MLRLLLCLALIVSSTASASALSCLFPDIAQSYIWASEGEQPHGVFVGRFVPLDGLPTDPHVGDMSDPQAMDQTVEHMFRFKGVRIEPNRQAPLWADVRVQAQCFAHWCGSFREIAAEDLLAIIEMDEDGNPTTLNLGPCPDAIFTPSKANIAQAQSCIRGEACEPIY